MVCVEDEIEDLNRVANKIVAELRRVGLNASWKGSARHPIVVEGIAWHRRRSRHAEPSAAADRGRREAFARCDVSPRRPRRLSGSFGDGRRGAAKGAMRRVVASCLIVVGAILGGIYPGAVVRSTWRRAAVSMGRMRRGSASLPTSPSGARLVLSYGGAASLLLGLAVRWWLVMPLAVVVGLARRRGRVLWAALVLAHADPPL